MYFFTFDTTTSMSRSTTSCRLTAVEPAPAAGGFGLVAAGAGARTTSGDDGASTTRRTTGVAGAAFGAGAGSGGLSATSLVHASFVGARASTAHASR